MREFKGKSIIALPTDYVVIDTETTGLDYNHCDLIEVSALKYCKGKCVDRFSSLIQPPLLYFFRRLSDDTGEFVAGYVDDFITELTGITNEMLADAPAPEDVVPKLLDFVGDSLLIGHNAHFDINFLYDAAVKFGDTPLRNDFIDTLRIARKVFPNLSHHRLADVAQACGIEPSGAHRAEADCVTTAACYEVMRNKVLEQRSEQNFIDLFNPDYSKALSSIKATSEIIDPTNPLYGKTVVFTGTLSSMTRKNAYQIVLNLGGIAQNSMNAKTNYLVIGSGEFVKSVKEGKTSKMKKAEALMKNGAEISIISEAAFFDLISDYI